MNNIKRKIGFKNNLDKLLFVFASIYLLLVAGWFWKNHENQQINSSSPLVKDNGSSPENQIFNGENKLPLDNQMNLLPVNNNTNNSSPSNLSSLLPSSTNETLTIPPLPNTNTNISTNLSEVSPIPIPPPPKPTLPPPPPLPSVNNFNDSSTLPPPPKLNKVPVLKTANTTTLPNNLDNNISTVVSPSTVTGRETKYNYTLQGVVELGNTNSVALFNINNVTEKVSVGGEIGATGWVLMGINDKQAVISRQNQSVYLRVGETF